MAALKRGDHRAAGEALRLQRDIIEQQRTLLLFRLSRVKSDNAVERPDAVAPAEGDGEPSPDPPSSVDQVAWTLKKNNHVVQAVLRKQPDGTELRCVYEGAVLWTEWFPRGHDPATLTQAVSGTLTAWRTKGFVKA